MPPHYPQSTETDAALLAVVKAARALLARLDADMVGYPYERGVLAAALAKLDAQP